MDLRSPKASLIAKARPLSLSALAQVVSSIANLALSLLLLSALSPADFGWFNLIFAASLGFSHIAVASLLIPVTVRLREGSDIIKIRVIQNNVLSSLLIATLILICGFAASGIIGWNLGWSRNTHLLIGLTGFSCLGLFAKESLTQAAYSYRAETAALLMNFIVLSGIGVTGLGYVFKLWSFSSLELVVSYFGGVNTLAALIGYLILFRSLDKPAFKQIRTRAYIIIYRCWWSLAGSTLYTIRTQSYTVISAALLGPAALGLISATRILFAPMLVVPPTISRVAIPRLVSYRQNDLRAFLRISSAMVLLYGGLAAMYSFGVVIVGQFVFNQIAKSYEYSMSLTLAWSIFVIAACVRTALETINQVQQAFKDLAYAGLISTFVSLILTVGFTASIGKTGAVVGAAIGELSAAVLFLRTFMILRSKPLSTPA